VAGLPLLFGGCTTADGPPGHGGGDSYLDGPFTARAGAFVAAPTEDPADNALVAELVTRIRHTPPGALIRIVGLSFSNELVSDALIAAHERGVRVQVLLDGRASRTFQAVARLNDDLGSDRSKPSWIHLTRGSARGGSTELHQKTWMFSRTGDSRRVVMVGSMNLTYYSAGQYTDMWSFVGQRRVWRVFNDVFADQARDRPHAAPFRSEPLGHGAHAWFYPGATLAADPRLAFLRSIPPRGARVRVVMYAWYGVRGRAAAEALATLQRGGAQVSVVHGKAFGKEVARILEAAGIPVHRGVWSDHGDDVHVKLILVDHPRAGGGRTRIVSTGSDNLADGGYGRDEVVVDVPASAADYRRYVEFADAIEQRAVDSGQ